MSENSYIALLRGINVGGKNLISMDKLKSIFVDLGFSSVRTYINSGNVLFGSEITQEKKLRKLCETALADYFASPLPVVIISLSDLQAALAAVPSWWGPGSDYRHNAIFVLPPAKPEELLQQIKPPQEKYEQLFIYGQIIFWSAAIQYFSRSTMGKISASPIYRHMTVRNANTTRKLLQLALNSKE